jgi:SAM-dependent methyltransferase
MYYFRRTELDEAMLRQLAGYDEFVRSAVGLDYRWPLRMRDWELAQVMRATPAQGCRRALEAGAFNTFLGLWLTRVVPDVVISDRLGQRRWKSLLRRCGLAPAKPTEAPFARWQQAFRRPGVKLLSVDLTRIPFPAASFDLVTCVSVLEHIPDYRRALAEMVRVLTPGGRLLLTTDVAPKSDRYHDGVRYFSPEELDALTAPYAVTSDRNQPDFARDNWCYGRGVPVVTAFVEITKGT